jgi:hypothetical protein
MSSVKKIRLSIAAATFASAFVIGGTATANASPDVNGSENGSVASATGTPKQQPAARGTSRRDAIIAKASVPPGPRPFVVFTKPSVKVMDGFFDTPPPCLPACYLPPFLPF